MTYMVLEFLGTGTSTGVPEAGCHCEVCTSSNPHDQRLRTSAWIQVGGKSILIDCGPDFRQQAIRAGIERIDALLITHGHYDHAGGLDDLRPYCKDRTFPIWNRRSLPIYGNAFRTVSRKIVIRVFRSFDCMRSDCLRLRWKVFRSYRFGRCTINCLSSDSVFIIWLILQTLSIFPKRNMPNSKVWIY